VPDELFGVLLMTYGSPTSLDDVPRYLAAVRGGRPPLPDLVAEFTRRYRLIGGSPLVEITAGQARALEARLGDAARVRAAMRFSPPTIFDGLRGLAEDGVRRVAGIILSPQYSPLLMSGYGRAVEAAREELGATSPDVRIAGAWHREPAFLEALAGCIRAALVDAGSELGQPGRSGGNHVLLTAHSLPRRVAEGEPDYIDQLAWTATQIAARAGLADADWTFCWQSAGHEPGEWMKPDFAELMPVLREAGCRSVLVAPIQFLADHLEILYDVDIAARQQAEAQGLRFSRIRSLNIEPRFIDALASVAMATLGSGAVV
jgi:ferrochelatase